MAGDANKPKRTERFDDHRKPNVSKEAEYAKELNDLEKENHHLERQLRFTELKNGNDRLRKHLKAAAQPSAPKMSNGPSKAAEPMPANATQLEIARLKEEMDRLRIELDDVKTASSIMADGAPKPADAALTPAPGPAEAPKPAEESKKEEPKKTTSYEDYPPEEQARQRAKDNPRVKGGTAIEREKIYHFLRQQGVSEARARKVSSID